jgi:hypothetical protein
MLSGRQRAAPPAEGAGRPTAIFFTAARVLSGQKPGE